MDTALTNSRDAVDVSLYTIHMQQHNVCKFNNSSPIPLFPLPYMSMFICENMGLQKKKKKGLKEDVIPFHFLENKR